MKIAIIGAGAMGSLFGGLLTEAGAAVSFFDVEGPHLGALQTAGLDLETVGKRRIIPVEAGVASGFHQIVDVVILFTKGFHTRGAVEAAAHLIGAGTWIMTVQNGLGNPEQIRTVLPGARLLIGMTNWPANLVAPGQVASNGSGSVHFFPQGGAIDDTLNGFVALCALAGLNPKLDSKIEVSIWEKVAFNAALNSICAVTGMTVGAVGASPFGQTLAQAVVAETVAVAHARGIEVAESRILAMVNDAFAHHLEHKPSMLQDLLAGRRTEIESINGAIVAEGKRLGVATPTVQVLYELVRLSSERKR